MTPLRGMTVVSPGLAGKDFKNSGPKQNEKYLAPVEDFNAKQAAEYHSLMRGI